MDKENARYLVCATCGYFYYRYRHTAFARAKALKGVLYERVNGEWFKIRSYLQ